MSLSCLIYYAYSVSHNQATGHLPCKLYNYILAKQTHEFVPCFYADAYDSNCAFVFATRIVQFLVFLNPTLQASSLLL